jgi:aspartate-semialdehyde dehydrogenase
VLNDEIMHVILVGATGLVGSACLQAMIASPAVTKVSILSRRPVQMAEGHSKVKTIIHNDFEKYDSAILSSLENATGCVWALGKSANGMKEE